MFRSSGVPMLEPVSIFRAVKLLCLAIFLQVGMQHADAQNAPPAAPPAAEPSAPPDLVAPAIPKFVRECHTVPENVEICGNWTWTAATDNGQEFEGRWLNGAVARMTIERFDLSGVAITRVDSDGPLAGVTARYQGKLFGEQMSGTATFAGGGDAFASRWIASFNLPTHENLPPPSMDAAPVALLECEGESICGSWNLNGQNGEAYWANRASAQLTVERFDAGGVVIHRTDRAGTLSAGLTAIYQGRLNGEFLEGTATWSWPGHVPASQTGPWLAAFSSAEFSSPANRGLMSVDEALLRARLAAKSRDYPVALNWFGKAGALGDARAGEKAVSALKQAKGDSLAESHLSMMYDNGWLVEADEDQAKFWQLKAQERVSQFDPICASKPVRNAMQQLARQANNNLEAAAMAELLKALTGMGVKGMEFDMQSAHASDVASDAEFRCDVTFAPQKQDVVDTSEANDAEAAEAAAGEAANEVKKSTPVIQEYRLVRIDNGNPAHYKVILEAAGSDAAGIPRVAFTRPYSVTVAVQK